MIATRVCPVLSSSATLASVHSNNVLVHHHIVYESSSTLGFSASERYLGGVLDWPPIDVAADLDVIVDRDAEVPLGVQLGWALCARISDGRMQPGQRLPALRDMAEASGLNVNTVRAVYQRLEQRGLLESHQGSGTFVAPGAQRRSAASTIAADAAREAVATGVDPREVAAALYVEPPTPAGSPAQSVSANGEEHDEPALRRRSLRIQIATLERAILDIEADHPGVAPPPQATHRAAGPALLSVHELEQVRAALVRRLAAVQSAIDEWTAGELEPASRTLGAPAAARTARSRARPKRPDEDVSPQAAAGKRKRSPRSTSRPATAGT